MYLTEVMSVRVQFLWQLCKWQRCGDSAAQSYTITSLCLLSAPAPYDQDARSCHCHNSLVASGQAMLLLDNICMLLLLQCHCQRADATVICITI